VVLPKGEGVTLKSFGIVILNQSFCRAEMGMLIKKFSGSKKEKTRENNPQLNAKCSLARVEERIASLWFVIPSMDRWHTCRLMYHCSFLPILTGMKSFPVSRPRRYPDRCGVQASFRFQIEEVLNSQDEELMVFRPAFRCSDRGGIQTEVAFRPVSDFQIEEASDN
jgi:hypothetical protein